MLYSVLLALTGLLLPRITFIFVPLPPPQSSLDKPQHPFLVPITASPVWTLFWLCTGVATCQAWWARSHSVRTAWANTLIVSALFHVVIVLFGAPITSHIPHTYLLSLLISLLTTFVPSYTLPLPTLWYSHSLTLSPSPLHPSVVYPTVGALVGAWAGAFPIPLDWDRPWQAWPLTPAYGALAGHIAGTWAASAAPFFASSHPEEVHHSPAAKKKRRKAKGE